MFCFHFILSKAEETGGFVCRPLRICLTWPGAMEGQPWCIENHHNLYNGSLLVSCSGERRSCIESSQLYKQCPVTKKELGPEHCLRFEVVPKLSNFVYIPILNLYLRTISPYISLVVLSSNIRIHNRLSRTPPLCFVLNWQDNQAKIASQVREKRKKEEKDTIKRFQPLS